MSKRCTLLLLLLTTALFCAAVLLYYRLPAKTAPVQTEHQADTDDLLAGNDIVTDPYCFREYLPGMKLDLNEATQPQLEALPSIGPKLAEAIIEWRESNGPFTATEDIMLVIGIGEGKYDAIREYITIGDPS